MSTTVVVAPGYDIRRPFPRPTRPGRFPTPTAAWLRLPRRSASSAAAGGPAWQFHRLTLTRDGRGDANAVTTTAPPATRRAPTTRSTDPAHHATLLSMSTSSPDLAPALAPPIAPRRPDLVDFLLVADLTGADALIEAAELYGDDADRELADLQAGKHPAQRSPRL